MAETKKKVIIDTDMALDDWPAVLYMLKRTDVEPLCISVTGAGEAHCREGMDTATRLLALSGRENENIPVFCGREEPLGKDHGMPVVFPSAWRRDANTVFGLELPSTKQTPVEGKAPELIKDIIDSVPEAEKVYILTLGPLTNLAELVLLDSGIVGRIENLTVMGGAFEFPGRPLPGHGMKGNIIVPGFSDELNNRDAEWNIYVDAVAADIVIRSYGQVTLVPLNATNQVPVTVEFTKCLEKYRHSGPEADFIHRVMEKNAGFVSSGEFYFWDPMAAVVFMDTDGSVCRREIHKISVDKETYPEAADYGLGYEKKPHYVDRYGETRLDGSGTPVEICVSASEKAFVNNYFEILTGESNAFEECLALERRRN